MRDEAGPGQGRGPTAGPGTIRRLSAPYDARLMAARLRSLLRPEDVLLFAWALVGVPLLGLLLGWGAPDSGGSNGDGAFDSGQPLRGLLFVVGVVCALGALSTRSAVPDEAALVASTTATVVAADAGPSGADPSTATSRAARRRLRQTSVPDLLGSREALLGPLFGGLLFLGYQGIDALSLPEGLIVVVPAGMVVGLVLQGTGRAPALPITQRRLLVLPFVLAGSVLFSGLVAGFDLGPGLLGDLVATITGRAGPGPEGSASFGLFVFGMLMAGAATFYAMLVIAPRMLVDREGGALAWTLRFLAWFGGSLAGLGWLAAFGR